MRWRVLLGALLGLLLAAAGGLAQTREIQDQVQKKLTEQKREQASLGELLAAALKNNADVRVAEAKVREADAELYRTRMNVLKRITMLRQEIKGYQAAARAATTKYERAQQLAAQKAIEVRLVDEAFQALLKSKADLAAAEAEMDALTGRWNEKMPAFAPLLGKATAGGNAVGPLLPSGRPAPVQPSPVGPQAPLPDLGGLRPGFGGFAGGVGGGFGPPPPEPRDVPEALMQKIQKALSTPYTSGPKAELMTANELIQKLRERTKGINLLSRVNNRDDEVYLQFSEPIPLGALFQWAEDQLGWRFIVRDYGIVAVPQSAVPPGAVLLMDIWPAKEAGGA